MSRGAARRATLEVAPPRLLMDGAIAALLLCGIAFFARAAIQPDSVAYFENAELFAGGRWAEALQGYWSPGYSLLLVPAMWLAGDDRVTFLAIAHLVQALLGIAALWLAMVAVRKRVPPAAQRAVFWGCAWVILRWLTQEFLTPDLLLCVLLLLLVARAPARTTRDRIWLGIIAGAGFIVKSSSWPWLAVAVVVAALRYARERSWRAFPGASVAAGAAVAGVFVLALSLHAGHATLGSVGPLNVRWFLGDPTRRTPDTDHGPHATKRLVPLPSGATVAAYDLRPTARAYAPWSDPEAWARGVPATSLSPLNAVQAAKSWRQNGGQLLRWFLPLGIGLALCVLWSDKRRDDSRWWSRSLDRPLVLVGACAALVFVAVHAEPRLLAPAALLILLGAWRDARGQAVGTRLTWAARAATAGVAVQLVLYLSSLATHTIESAAFEDRFHQYFDRQLALHKKSGAIIIGSADLWMGRLWRHHMHVDVQIGAEGEPQLRTLSDQQRLQWLRDNFGDGSLGVGDATVKRAGGVPNIYLGFTPW